MKRKQSHCKKVGNKLDPFQMNEQLYPLISKKFLVRMLRFRRTVAAYKVGLRPGNFLLAITREGSSVRLYYTTSYIP